MEVDKGISAEIPSDPDPGGTGIKHNHITTKTLMNTQNNTNVSKVTDSSNIDNNTSKINMTPIKDNNYEQRDLGPYTVYIESKDRNIGNCHPMTIGKYLHGLNTEISSCIMKIIKIGKNRVSVTMKTAKSANLLVKYASTHEDYCCYIPNFLVRRQGVIRDVDISLQTEELIKIIKPMCNMDMQILHIKRFQKRRMYEGNVTYIDTPVIMVTFKGQALPTHVSIFSVVCSVEPFVQQVVQCYSCLRYGHVAKQCKGKERCSKCGNSHKSSECVAAELNCVFCNANHSSTDKVKCGEYKKQQNIKIVMCNENVSYNEAVSKVVSSYSSAVSSTAQSKSQPQYFSSDQHFPELSETTRKRKKTNENNQKYIEVENLRRSIVSQPRPTSGNGIALKSNVSPIDTNDYKSLINAIKDLVLELSNTDNRASLNNLENTIKIKINSLFPISECGKPPVFNFK